jgi:hypothetical protein
MQKREIEVGVYNTLHGKHGILYNTEYRLLKMK